MSLLSRPLVLYKGAKRQISDIFIEVRGFAVNWRWAVFIQIYDKILLLRENYIDTVSVVVDFISYDNELQALLGKNAFLLIFKDITDVSKMAKD